LIWQGKLTASFPTGMDKFESREFEVSKTEEFIPGLAPYEQKSQDA
jgi:hypothetical protein